MIRYDVDISLKNKSCRRMFSLSYIAILVCGLSLSLSLYAYTYHLLECVLSCIESYYYRIIIDRLLIKGKGGEDSFQQGKTGTCRSRSYVTSR